jgi:hypothetical protein
MSSMQEQAVKSASASVEQIVRRILMYNLPANDELLYDAEGMCGE